MWKSIHFSVVGNSLKTVKSTFNCPKPNTGWWTKKKEKTQEEKDREKEEELAEIKRKENALMNQALCVEMELQVGKLTFAKGNSTKGTVTVNKEARHIRNCRTYKKRRDRSLRS